MRHRKATHVSEEKHTQIVSLKQDACRFIVVRLGPPKDAEVP